MNTSQGPFVSRRTTPSGKAEIASHLLGPHPVIAHFLGRMNLEAILRGALGSARQGTLDHARTLTVLVHNLLVSPGPLYRVAEWTAPWEPQVLGLTSEQKTALNDDRVARSLDALSSERGRGIWFRLALRVIKQFDVDTSRVHFDTSTVTFHGKYETSVTEPKITHGHNKDHRPDLKQLLFGLTVSADGAVPLHHFVQSGNRTDDGVHQGNLEELRRILGRDDFTYVADSKLCTADSLIEREVRRGMKRDHIEALPLLPEGRETKTPTCPRILEAFNALGWQEFTRGEEVIAFPITLTPLQKEVLRLLGVPAESYK